MSDFKGIKDWLLDEFKRRSDPDINNTSRLRIFTEEAEQMYAHRFGEYVEPRLIADSDRNLITDNHDLLYKYGMAKSLCRYLDDKEGAAFYDDLWKEQCNHMNIHYRGTDWAQGPPVMLSEAEQAVIDDAN